MTEPAPQGPATSPTDAETATSATQDPAPATNPSPAAQEPASADIAAASKALAWLRKNHADYGLNVEISGPRGDRHAVLYDARRDLKQASESGRIMLECHETGGAKVRDQLLAWQKIPRYLEAYKAFPDLNPPLLQELLSRPDTGAPSLKRLEEIATRHGLAVTMTSVGVNSTVALHEVNEPYAPILTANIGSRSTDTAAQHGPVKIPFTLIDDYLHAYRQTPMFHSTDEQPPEIFSTPTNIEDWTRRIGRLTPYLLPGNGVYSLRAKSLTDQAFNHVRGGDPAEAEKSLHLAEQAAGLPPLRPQGDTEPQAQAATTTRSEPQAAASTPDPQPSVPPEDAPTATNAATAQSDGEAQATPEPTAARNDHAAAAAQPAAPATTAPRVTAAPETAAPSPAPDTTASTGLTLTVKDKVYTDRQAAAHQLRAELMGAYAAVSLNPAFREVIGVSGELNGAAWRARIDQAPDTGELFVLIDTDTVPPLQLRYSRDQVENAGDWLIADLAAEIANASAASPAIGLPSPALAAATAPAPPRTRAPRTPTAAPDQRTQTALERIREAARNPEAISAAYKTFKQVARQRPGQPVVVIPGTAIDNKTDPWDLKPLEDAMQQAAEHEPAFENDPQWQRIKRRHAAAKSLIDTIKQSTGAAFATLAADGPIRAWMRNLMAHAARLISSDAFLLARRLRPRATRAWRAVWRLRRTAFDHAHRLLGHLRPGQSLETEADLTQAVQDLKAPTTDLPATSTPSAGRSAPQAPNPPSPTPDPAPAGPATTTDPAAVPGVAARTGTLPPILAVAGDYAEDLTDSPEWQRVTRMWDFIQQTDATLNTWPAHPDRAPMAEAIATRALEVITNSTWELMSRLDAEGRRGSFSWRTTRLMHHAANQALDDAQGFTRPDKPPIGHYDGITSSDLREQTERLDAAIQRDAANAARAAADPGPVANDATPTATDTGKPVAGRASAATGQNLPAEDLGRALRGKPSREERRRRARRQPAGVSSLARQEFGSGQAPAAVAARPTTDAAATSASRPATSTTEPAKGPRRHAR